MKKKNGFTLAELLIVVAIIAVLVAIAIPIFSSQLEKSREATDLANVRSAYAEVMASVSSGSISESKTIDLKQKQDGWSISTPITIGGITSGTDGSDNSDGTWVGKPVAGKSCTVSYTDGKVTIKWNQNGEPETSAETTEETTPSCILSGTQVTLADGSTKLIDDITTEDLLMTFNLYTGAIDKNYPMYILKHEDKDSIVIKITLNNGTIVEVSDSQQFFDMNVRDYFEINALNYQNAVGKNIFIVEKGSVTSAKIIAASAEDKVCNSYEIYTEYNKNFIANGVLTLEPGTWRQGVCTINEDLTIDMEQYQEDVEVYGRYTYDEFEDIMTEEQFEKMKVADVKIAVGKGLISEDEMFDLYSEWMPVYNEAIN